MQLSLIGFLVFALVGLTVLVVVVGGVLATRSQEQRACPECGELGLRWVTGVRATIQVEGGRAPDSWSLYECRSCQARLKDHHGAWESPSDSDLRHFDAT